MTASRTVGRLLATAAIVLTASCGGQLRVKVSVLDPTYVDGEVDRLLLEKTRPLVLAETDAAVDDMFQQFANDNFEPVTEYTDKLKQAVKGEPQEVQDSVEAQAGRLQTYFAETVSPIHQSTKDRVKELNVAVRELWESEEDLAGDDSKQEAIRLDSIAKLRSKSVQLLRQRQRSLENLVRVVSNFFEELGIVAESLRFRGRGDSELLGSILNFARDRQEDIKSLTRGQTLTESPFAYAVASVPKKRWRTTFNEAYGSGFLGNVNVAIKMGSHADFTVKGLSFDPTDVVRAAARVTTQAVLLSAQIAGVPVSVDGEPTPTAPAGGALARSSARLEAAQRELAEQRARLGSFQEALQVLAEIILEERPEFQSLGEQRRREAIRAIKQRYEAQKPRLELKEEDDAGSVPGSASGAG